jgi:hypothetical protein
VNNTQDHVISELSLWQFKRQIRRKDMASDFRDGQGGGEEEHLNYVRRRMRWKDAEVLGGCMMQSGKRNQRYERKQIQPRLQQG